MLSTKRQRKYIRKINKEAVSHLEKIAGPSPEADLHHFRVAIKKLKSIGIFLSPAAYKKHIKPLKKVFVQTGNLRDTRNADLIEERHFMVPPAIKDQRLREFNAACAKFASGKAAYRKCFTKTSKRLYKKIKSVLAHRLANYFEKELAEIPKYLRSGSDNSFHSGRKRLKNLLYLYHMLSRASQKQLPVRIHEIDELQETIGKWHDLMIAEPILRKRINRAQLLMIKKEKESLLEEARKMSAGFLDQHERFPESEARRAVSASG